MPDDLDHFLDFAVLGAAETGKRKVDDCLGVNRTFSSIYLLCIKKTLFRIICTCQNLESDAVIIFVTTCWPARMDLFGQVFLNPKQVAGLGSKNWHRSCDTEYVQTIIKAAK